MHCRFSCGPPEAPSDLDQQRQHRYPANDEIAQRSGFTAEVTNEEGTHASKAIDGGIRNEGKLTPRQAPGERRSTRAKQPGEPYARALPVEHAREHCPKEDIGYDVQISAEEMRLQPAAFKKCSAHSNQQGVEKRIFSILIIRIRRPARDR